MLASLFAPLQEFDRTTHTVALATNAEPDTSGQSTTGTASVAANKPRSPTLLSLHWKALHPLLSFVHFLSMIVLTAS